MRQNNLGVAYMNREAIAEALGHFQQAYKLDPKLSVVRLNEAIALLNTQKYEPARAIFDEIVKQDPRNPYAWFNLGLLEMDTNKPEAALDAFERVARIDPEDADTRFFIGKLNLQLRRYPAAIAAFESALKIDPFHVSAEFALAQAYMRSGDQAKAREHLARFQHLTTAKLGEPMTLVYGQQGKYSQAVAAAGGVESVPPEIPVRFVDVTKDSGLPTAVRPAPADLASTAAGYLGSGACVFDYDGDGKPDILLVNLNGAPALYRNAGNSRFADVTKGSGIAIPGPGIGCTVGDYNNDGRPDLAISYDNGIALFENQGGGKFVNVTKQAGINTTGLVLGLTFVDYDHDGDLDLYAVRFPNSPVNRSTGAMAMPPGMPFAPNVLWRNDGNGKFTDATAATGLQGSGLNVAATLSDINNDRAVDLVLTGMRGGTAIYLNPREGEFRRIEPWASPFSAPTVGVTALDFNKDGWMDLAFTQGTAPGLSLWRNADGKKFVSVPFPHLDWARGWGLTALDYDNDGWVDLAAVGTDAQGKGHIALFRNEGPAGFRDVTRQVGLDKIHLRHPRSIIAADFYGDGTTDLLITQNDGPPVLLRNVGANRNHSLALKFEGTNDNRSALGTKVEIFSGTQHQKWEIAGASGYLGQGPATLTAGLGSRTEADIVRMLWPTGVLQDEIHIAAGRPQLINEIDRRGSSCPLLFAWDGHRYRFISDLLGSGVVGHWIAPGQRNIPDPSEYMKLDGAMVRPRDGRLSFRLLEPMEELDYLDQVRLLAIDHPAGVDVYPNARFSMEPPFPRFKVIVSRGAHPPLGAWDGAGHNVLPQLLKRDHRFVEGFASTPFAGIAAMHTLELDLGAWNPRRPLRLLLTGFTDYFSASSLYAASQARLKPVAPYVEALEPDGRWKRVVADMGFPAGLERTMVADLTGRLPAGTRRVRIVTNLKVYWDQILVDNAPRDIPVHVVPVPLAGARLEFRGFPRAIEGHPEADLRYDYDDISPTGPYARQVGDYTRYGDVLPLLTHADEEDVVFGSGEEVAVEFNPSSLPPLPRGWKRDYFFYANGFDKDMDFYAKDGGTVAPMPFHTLIPYPYRAGFAYPDDARHVRYQLEYNTRSVAGPVGNTYRFQYRSEPPH
ncbi:MAG: VCBS repeat-containing protein [Acidobacteriota bacterium]|nr:VCBS repeat-containing protein [Acidobacteriota bacterium]